MKRTPGDRVEVSGTIEVLGGMLSWRPWVGLRPSDGSPLLHVVIPPFQPAHWRLQKTTVGQSVCVQGTLVDASLELQSCGHRVVLRFERFLDHETNALRWARLWGACTAALEWLEERPTADLDSAWAACPHLAWILWTLVRLDPSDDLLQQLFTDFGYPNTRPLKTTDALLMTFNSDRTGAAALQILRRRLPRPTELLS